jgi:hypothetical protein
MQPIKVIGEIFIIRSQLSLMGSKAWNVQSLAGSLVFKILS